MKYVFYMLEILVQWNNYSMHLFMINTYFTGVLFYFFRERKENEKEIKKFCFSPLMNYSLFSGTIISCIFFYVEHIFHRGFILFYFF